MLHYLSQKYQTENCIKTFILNSVKQKALQILLLPKTKFSFAIYAISVNRIMLN